MKKYFFPIVSLLFVSAVTVFGQENQEKESRFKAGEFDLSPFLTYVDKVGDNWGAGASMTYFVSERLGIGVSTYWTDLSGSFFDNLSGEAYFRLPLMKRIAPYAVGSIGYEFDTEEVVETLGLGLDFRPFKNLAAFSDIQWRFANETKDGAFLRIGIRLTF